MVIIIYTRSYPSVEILQDIALGQVMLIGRLVAKAELPTSIDCPMVSLQSKISGIRQGYFSIKSNAKVSCSLDTS